MPTLAPVVTEHQQSARAKRHQDPSLLSHQPHTLIETRHRAISSGQLHHTPSPPGCAAGGSAGYQGSRLQMLWQIGVVQRVRANKTGDG
ncbi:hypothetical protein HYQ46_007691 [Verticillium longisporum]|nr:hypothetical protein HYQ46_007691 [Verticillium longisporum]